MPRLLAVFLLFGLTPAARATLAVVVPARDGLAIAADSRFTFLGASCDGAFKILTPAWPARTAVLVTGDSVFVPPPPAGTHDPCRYLATAPRLLDIGAVVTRALEQQAGANPARIDLAAVERSCLDALSAFEKHYPGALHAYAGRTIFSVVIASYNPAQSTAVLRNFAVRLDARTSQIEIERSSETVLTPQSKSGIWIYGESRWLNRAVYGGPGRRFLGSPALRLLAAHAPIATVERMQAAAAAENIVSAAIRTAKTIPPPSGIGGAIRTVFLGASRRARPLNH